MKFPNNLTRQSLVPGDRVEVTEGDLVGRQGEVVLPGISEILVRLAPGDGWPSLNMAGFHPRSLKRLADRTARPAKRGSSVINPTSASQSSASAQDTPQP
jgi:hypothetical protein